MRRIVEAVRSFVGRIPLVALIPDLLLIGGYLGLAYWLSLYEDRLAVGWLAGVPFLMGLAATVREFARGVR